MKKHILMRYQWAFTKYDYSSLLTMKKNYSKNENFRLVIKDLRKVHTSNKSSSITSQNLSKACNSVHYVRPRTVCLVPYICLQSFIQRVSMLLGISPNKSRWHTFLHWSLAKVVGTWSWFHGILWSCSG